MIGKIYKIFKLLIVCLTIMLLLFFGIYLFKKLVVKDKVTEMFGYSFWYVETGSMEPEICAGDLIVVKEKDNNYYDVGMNVTYLLENANTPVTHKIVNREGNMITTRGVNVDTNNTDDEPFDVNLIIGEVVYIWSGYYKFINFVKSPLGIICLALIGFVLIEGFSLLDKKLLKKEE